MKFRQSLALGLGWTVGMFGTVNYFDFTRRPACFDCGFPRGVPFALSYDASFNDVGRTSVDRNAPARAAPAGGRHKLTLPAWRLRLQPTNAV